MAARSTLLHPAMLAFAIPLLPGCSGSMTQAGHDGGTTGAADAAAASTDAGGPACAANDGLPCGPGARGYSCTGEDPSSGGLACTVYAHGQGGEVDYCCDLGAGGDEAAGVPSVPGCQSTGQLTCPGVAYAYGCEAGRDPSGVHTLACATGGSYDGSQLYCCFPWSLTATCVPQDPAAGGCPSANAFAFRCTASGDAPPAFDAQLMCDTGTLEASGQYADFCCNYE